MRRLGPLFVVAALALFAGTAWAAFEQEGGPYATGDAPAGAYAADFSGDGRRDIAVVNGTSSTVSLFFRGAGGFAPAETIDVGAGSGPSFAALGDYDGNGRADLAVANFVAGNVVVLKSGGAAGIVTESSPTSARLSAIGAGNFDADASTDVVVAEWDNAQVRILNRNPANTGFTQGATFATGANPRQIDVADFNGDGFSDIAVSNSGSGTVTVLLRSGGSFVAEGSFPVGTAPQDLAIADYNGDNRPDIAVANFTSSTVSILLRNLTNDGFTQEAGSPTAVATGPQGLTSADFNVDGRPDLAVATNDGVQVLLRSAGGGFVGDALLAPDAYGITAADFDGDARPDIAATSNLSSQLRVFRNPAPAQPPTPTPVPPAPTPTPPLPEPVAGRSVNATPVQGTVKVKLPGSRRYVDLAKAEQLPVGTTVDARNGAVQLTAAGEGGTAKFFDGIFKISQTKGKRPLTTLTLTETLSCPKAKKSAVAAAKKKSRKLWGDGKGAFRTQGKYSAATVRGTKWLVTDYCDRTVTRVTQGSVTVQDQVKKIKKVVRAGKRYTARRK